LSITRGMASLRDGSVWRRFKMTGRILSAGHRRADASVS
jgi:hypothetical protein